MFPKANIPVFQLSLDLSRSPLEHFELARELKPLREKGVLIIGSGNLVHNLTTLVRGGSPYDWAEEFDVRATEAISKRDFRSLAEPLSFGRTLRLAHPTPDSLDGPTREVLNALHTFAQPLNRVD